MNEQNNYSKYRGKCKEMSESLSAEMGYRLVRGHYYCPFWGKQAHWWTVDGDGMIHDPTRLQFPSFGNGEYVEFDGWTKCAECEKRIHENDAVRCGNYAVCSNECACALVGL